MRNPSPKQGLFRFIAGNPPYLCFKRLPEYFKTIYTNHLHARPDLLFNAHAAELAASSALRSGRSLCENCLSMGVKSSVWAPEEGVILLDPLEGVLQALLDCDEQTREFIYSGLNTGYFGHEIEGHSFNALDLAVKSSTVEM